MTDNEKSTPAARCWPPKDDAGGRKQKSSGFLSTFLGFFADLKKDSPLTSDEISAPDNFNTIRIAIRSKYAQVALSADGKFKYPTGQKGALALNYDQAIIANASPELLESFCSVGNPFSIAALSPGDQVLDIGCGAGFDMIVASSQVGEEGKVCGIDLTEEMVNRARKNLKLAAISNFEIHHVESEEIPYPDKTFDVVTSNGVINLSPQKEHLFKEIFRVLKPGGRLQFADIILQKELPDSLAASPEAWSQWIGGTVPVGDQLKMMQAAGFHNAEFLGETGFATSDYTGGALFRGCKDNKAKKNHAN